MQQLYDAIINNLLRINTQPRSNKSGVWYSNQYEQEFNISSMKYREGYANPEYWYIFRDILTFRLKPGKKPSAAIKAFISGLTIADSGSVLTACIYAGLLDLLGDEKFDELFSSPLSEVIIEPVFSAWNIANPLELFIEERKNTLTNTQVNTLDIEHLIRKGDWCYFTGCKSYPKQHPGLSDQGFHMICTGQNANKENMYLGFNWGKWSEPLTAKKIIQYLEDSYAQPRNEYSKLVIDYFRIHDERININYGKGIDYFDEKTLDKNERAKGLDLTVRHISTDVIKELQYEQDLSRALALFEKKMKAKFPEEDLYIHFTVEQKRLDYLFKQEVRNYEEIENILTTTDVKANYASNPQGNCLYKSPRNLIITSPLLTAIEDRNLEIVKLLFIKGIELEKEISSETRDTALTLAITKGHLEIAKYILSQSEAVSPDWLRRKNGVDERGKDALTLAAEKEWTDLCEEISTILAASKSNLTLSIS